MQTYFQHRVSKDLPILSATPNHKSLGRGTVVQLGSLSRPGQDGASLCAAAVRLFRSPVHSKLVVRPVAVEGRVQQKEGLVSWLGMCPIIVSDL